MGEIQNSKRYDLEERTLSFAQRVREYVKRLPRTAANIEDCKQLVRASGSVGANYIEANESLSKKDFIVRVKICRKEAKECGYWSKLLDCSHESLQEERERLVQETHELTLIFASILRNSQ